MQQVPLEVIFKVLDDTALILQAELDCTYLEALAESGENIFQEKVLQEELSEVAKKRLDKQYLELSRLSHTKEDIRKAFQLAVLKGMRENIQPNHQMTPDSIGYFISFFIDKLYSDKNTFTLLDPAIGTGNLVTTVMNQLSNKTVLGFGSDVDDLLIKLAYVSANLQEHSLTLYNQDSLENLLIDPVDLVLCDLPVGYYPNDSRASEFTLRAESGHSFAHHLFIEQSTLHTKPGGYLFFIIPNNLFESTEAPKLHTFIKENLHIQALLQLPETMFKNKNAAKSIFILQKVSEDIQAPKEVLLANLPSLSNKQAISSVISKIDQWIKENK